MNLASILAHDNRDQPRMLVVHFDSESLAIRIATSSLTVLDFRTR